jgi:ribonuclease HI
MSVPSPHFLLFSESSKVAEPGRWRFLLRSSDGVDRLVADDVEPETRGERLELLTVVRGLEALDQPSRVTVISPSAYVEEGIRYGVPEWRRNGWCWEKFGQMIPVKNCDLWQRLDRALRFHQVECRRWGAGRAHGPRPFSAKARSKARYVVNRGARGPQFRAHVERIVEWCRSRLGPWPAWRGGRQPVSIRA